MNNIKKLVYYRYILLLCCLLQPGNTSANVCQEGLGIPPFLSSGAKPNLLLALDNSGSMLDTAYVNTVGECVDNGFDTTKTYAGLFDPEKWYQWTAGVPQWLSGTTYNVGDYVYTEGIFYKATAKSGGASVGASIDADTSTTWTIVYQISKWTNGTVYPAKSFVRYDNQLYYSAAGGTANDSNTADGVTIQGDTMTWIPVDSTWLAGQSYNIGNVVSDHGMLFRAASAGTAAGTGTADDTGVSWIRLDEGYFVEAAYTTSDEAATALSAASGDGYKQDNLYTKILSVGGVQSGVTAFAASGNLLNWASASKFDIQKKILTGGKYNENQQSLVSEGRGCSSRGFIKEVGVTHQASGASNVITFSVRGFSDDDWLDTTDDTSRISILGVSAEGFIGSDRQEACQTVIDEVAKGEDANQGIIRTNVDTCLDYSGANNVLAESNAAYNHSIHTCWSIVKKGYTIPSDLGNVSEITNACQNIYNNGVSPVTIDPYNSGYMCYGVYNSTIPDANEPTGTGSSREGYVGRCWEPGTLPAGCSTVPCNGPYDTGNPRCMADNLTYVCSGNYNSSKDTCNKAWKLKLEDTDPADAFVCDTTASATPGGWTNDNNPNSSLECIQEAMWDYCGSLKIPEVIDPSDQIFNTGETWGMVGAMIDSGVVAMFGTDRPLLVMKGYIRQASAPEGIIQEVAEDLRIGAMAFNDNGAKTECDETIKTDTIEQYCPTVNHDGAKVISPIKDGLAINAASGLQHVEELTAAINDIRATSWTPLAEAIYNALGYYGQNTNLRLDQDDFKTEGEDPNFEDPVEYWCQENNILVITEGASTADINTDVAAKISSLAGSGVEDPTVAAASEGQCLNEEGQSDLFGSTFFDDLTFAGQNAINAGIYSVPTLQSDDGAAMNKQNIRTYMVVTGVPRDDGSDEECNPATIMENAAENGGTNLLTGEDPAQLEANLRAAFSDILFRTSAGSAASVISSSRSGEGGVYQAIFWPKIARGIGKDPLLWAGDVHAFFIDEHGLLWDDYSGNNSATQGELWTEDTNANGILDPGEDVYPLDADGNPDPNNVLDGDRRIVTFFNEATNSTQICFNPSVVDTGVCAASDYFGTLAGAVELRDFNKYLWSAAVQLQTVSEISANRAILADGSWDFRDNRRYIFTWNDLDNDGIVDSDFDDDGSVDDDGSGNGDQEEILQFVSGINAAPLSVADAVSPRNGLLSDFNVTSNEELDRLIEWLRGNDIYEADLNNNGVLEPAEDINNNGVRDYAFRCRKYNDCDDPNALNNPTWRLGDVIHSTPTLVARPAEGYHLVYNDQSYALFYKKYMERRHVIYFGGNDGMLHAVNGGFYQAGKNKFLSCRENQLDASKQCISATPYSANSAQAYPALGDELWAYVPYNLQPHLSCLADPEYAHKYFVDAPPRVFDARIFPNDDIHPGGWGTILVGYMRLGGSPTLADESAPFTDNRKFVSSYFILDVTDPERPPKVLAEMTMTTDEEDYDSDGTLEPKYTPMGYTTVMPTVAAMRDDLGNSEWYLVFGNGPTTPKGANDQQGRVAIVPLSALTGVNWKLNPNGDYEPSDRKPFRIPNEEPTATSTVPHFGRKLIEADSNGGINSFTGDMVTVDVDVRSPAIPGIGVPYKSDAVYFGTVDGSDFDAATRTYWDGDGRMFRLVTRIVDPLTGNEQYSYPESWYFSKLLDAHGPITAAPNLGYDKSNFWVYFGTGRFFAPEDKTDSSTQYFFGVKEPFGVDCKFTWATVDWWPVASASPNPTDPDENPGSQGLLRTDQIKVVESDPTDPGKFLGNYFYCDGCTIPPQLNAVNTTDVDSAHTYYKFNDLEKYIQGETCGNDDNDTTIGIDGWYREFYDLRERSLGMPTLLGGLVTYTSYRPFADICRAEGTSFLFGVYYLTGTAWYESIFGTDENPEQKLIVKDRLDLGKGLATTPSLQTGGGPNDVNAYIQTSTGEIVRIGQNNLPLFNFKSGRTSWRTR